MSAATKAAERDALERLQRDVRKHARDESVEIDAARCARYAFRSATYAYSTVLDIAAYCR